MNIQVVDDSMIIRRNLIQIFESFGHKVVVESDCGYDAIEQYKSHQPDLVTMDISMPGVQGITDGIQALIEIKRFDPEAKVVMITSHGEETLVMKAISKGAKGYILKPITPEKVEEVLKKFE